MAEYSHKRFIVTINGENIDGWDDSTDSFVFAPVGDAGAFTSAFGNSVWVDSGNYAETCTLKFLQHHPNNGFLQKLFNDQRRDLSEANRIQLRAYDPVNGEEITAVNGRIQNQGSFTRGSGHNPNTWVIAFPEVNRKLPD
ncbi:MULTISPECIES: DUF3277 domain-containing protein [Enterobacteriaceae]|uniref:DUF3277 domain-containing protein n=1 Tax=Enterobacteriaceae TaxID=543 RepID=UPI002E2D989B|nr:DUF3277 domain-containing protein [Klebsiella pneumoniae]MED6004940.1 DUF3277 domain-containing protein [Klebsiella pneumoniae]MED6058246.1 DUF3277 domain-containing protein [Klebsiella pneumoniae]